jgi:hypothetical protein
MQSIPLCDCKGATEDSFNFAHCIAKLPILVPIAQIARFFELFRYEGPVIPGRLS